MQLGLYVDPFCKHVARGVVPYTPSYELWSDGAEKQRYIYLPEGTQIDTTNPDRWAFPVGTRLYKTFSQNGLKLETRVFEKTAEPRGIASWTLTAYAWLEDQRSVELVGPEGAQNVLGTEHDIPKNDDCVRCHTRAGEDIVNGFEAVQLNHEGRGWTLERLIDQDRLVNGAGAAPNVTLDNARVPGRSVDRAALGYLHANCGNCHVGPTAPPKAQPLDLSLQVGQAAVTDTAAYKVAAACNQLKRWTGHDPFVFVIDPGSAATSGIIGRMGARPWNALANDQMPPVGTEQIDETGMKQVSAWIDQLDLHCDPPVPTPTPTP